MVVGALWVASIPWVVGFGDVEVERYEVVVVAAVVVAVGAA